jgi:hypothetical protein
LSYRRTVDSSKEAQLDLTLQRGSEVRRLRFFGAQDLRVDEGFPFERGLCFVDIRARGMEGIAISVQDVDQSMRGVRFYARDVIELKGDDPVA